jgi:hypothetical protein
MLNLLSYVHYLEKKEKIKNDVTEVGVRGERKNKRPWNLEWKEGKKEGRKEGKKEEVSKLKCNFINRRFSIWTNKILKFIGGFFLTAYCYNLVAEISSKISIKIHLLHVIALFILICNIEKFFKWNSPSTGPVRISSVDDFSTQDTYLEQIYLLLHIIESRL